MEKVRPFYGQFMTVQQQRNALLSTTFFCVAGVPIKRESIKSLQNSVRTHSMVYVRGVELTGKTETFELKFPYSSSSAYAGPFYVRLFRRMLNVCFCLATLIFSALDSRRSP